MDRILIEDIESFRLPEEISEKLRGSTVIVTGATGLIGSLFVRCVGTAVEGIRWILPVRCASKARRIFSYPYGSSVYGDMTIIENSLVNFFNATSIKADYIVHCASPTNGEEMTSRPVETFLLAVESTNAALDYSRRFGVRGMVYVSSLEYYGQRFDDSPIVENMTGVIDHSSPRSSYPLGKQAAEYLCFSYTAEFGTPVMSARLTQTFGAGIAPDDNRVFAQFARSVIAGTDIVLHTHGRSAKPYCYTTDCIAALAHILIKGKPGEAYNVATPGTYISIRDFAEIFRDAFNPQINVTVQLRGNSYAPETQLNLCVDKLLALGWQPRYNLLEMLSRLVESIKSTPSDK